MFFALARRAGGLVLAASACAGAVGCTRASANESFAPAAPATDNGSAAPLVRFDVNGVLAVNPSQTISVGLDIEGPDAAVSVYLDGAYGDAWLSSGSVTTMNGHADFVLHAPTGAATFALHARLGDSDARLDVAVGAGGFSDVSVSTSYLGHRALETMTGSVFVATSCDNLSKLPVDDGSPLATADANASLLLPSVPQGVALAISVRIGHYARGCTDVTPSPANGAPPVKVVVYDVPLALDAVNLATSHSFDPSGDDATAYDTFLESAVERASDAFVAPRTDEGGALLDAMASALPSASQSSFASARAQNGWDNATATWLAAHPPGLVGRTSAWLEAAKGQAHKALLAHVAGTPTPGKGTVSLDSWGAVIAPLSGLAPSGSFTWTADADDTIHLAGSFTLWPTVYLAHAADISAATSLPGAIGVADALASQIDCAGLGAALGAATLSCDAMCTARLCASAIGTMWQNAAAASSVQNDRVDIGMVTNAHATVGDHAEPVTFDGSWVGTLTTASGVTIALEGKATATH